MGGLNTAPHHQSGGTQGVPPRPGSMLEQPQEAHSDIIATVDPVEGDAKLLEACRIHLDEGPITLGTVGGNPALVVVGERLRNVRDTGLTGSWDLGFPGTADPEPFLFAD